MTKPWLGKVGALFIQKEDASFRHTLVLFFGGKQYDTLLLFCLNCIKNYNTGENVSYKLPNLVICAYLCNNKKHSPYESYIQG